TTRAAPRSRTRCRWRGSPSGCRCERADRMPTQRGGVRGRPLTPPFRLPHHAHVRTAALLRALRSRPRRAASASLRCRHRIAVGLDDAGHRDAADACPAESRTPPPTPQTYQYQVFFSASASACGKVLTKRFPCRDHVRTSEPRAPAAAWTPRGRTRPRRRSVAAQGDHAMPSMNRRTLLAAGATAAALTPALAACGGGSSSGGGASDKPLQFVVSGDANQGGGYAAMAKKYKEETGVEVEIVDVPYDDLATKITNAARANDLPALARMPSLDPAWLDRTADLADIAAEVKPIEGMYAEDENGKIPSLPSDLTAVGMFLNKDLWDEAGVSYPASFDDKVWTWDEFVDAATEVRETTGVKFSMAFDRSSHRLNSFLYQFGSEGL